MYIDFILKKAPVVFTQIDRDKHSKTYGSCDRNHWHLKIRDFTSAILQQSGLTLAILYQTEFEGNIYYRNENVREWAEATVYYWAKIQLSDGSFNEYYPWEHGFPPTAFSLYSSCEIYKRLHMQDREIEGSIRKTCKYLARHIEKEAFNQEIASITAMYSAYTILNEGWILDALERKLTRVLSLQDEEGWFPEYGGADIGYLSVALDMLAEYYWMSRDKRVEGPLNKVIDFLKYFLHSDGTIGGEYGSRNTTYFLPNGLQLMSSCGNNYAESMLLKLFGDATKADYFLDSVDDRYLSHYLMHSFLRALEKRQMDESVKQIPLLPMEVKHIKVFQHCGLISFYNGAYGGIISMQKGGLVRILQGDKVVFWDCGYRINFNKGSVAATNWQDPSYQCKYAENQYCVSGNFNIVGQKVSTPILHMGLRVVAFLIGNRIIHTLKKKIILVDKHIDVQFERKILIQDQELCICDSISGVSSGIVEPASNMSLRHVASGKFFAPTDLYDFSNRNIKTKLNIQLRTTVNFQSGTVEVAHEQFDSLA